MSQHQYALRQAEDLFAPTYVAFRDGKASTDELRTALDVALGEYERLCKPLPPPAPGAKQ